MKRLYWLVALGFVLGACNGMPLVGVPEGGSTLDGARDGNGTSDGNGTGRDGGMDALLGDGSGADGSSEAAVTCFGRTCADMGVNCGPIADGCGGVIECGSCPSGQTCGGGGMPSVCGAPPACAALTCATANANCGPIGDGCGGMLDCGTCPSGQLCGAGGPSRCGVAAGGGDGGTCAARTCAMAGANCGMIGDGCGGVLSCGSCAAGQVCGVTTPSVCGTGNPDGGAVCRPRTCAMAGTNCGPVADGCGGMLNCGTCPSGQTCGLGGPNVCGAPMACAPRTCAMAGANCGPVADGCGALLNCGNCTAPETCGGGGRPSVCGYAGDAGSCTNLCLRQVTCAGSATTSLSGTVFAPNGVDPLYNAVVYIPNGTVQPFTAGVACDQCGAPLSGSPLVTATTGPDGRFVLTNVPTGANVPLVIQLGRWRRQVVVPAVANCVNTAVSPTLTRLPRNHTEGDIPHMAMVTGNVDRLECVLRKIGIDDAEFTTTAGTGRVHIYTSNASNGANAGGATQTMGTLMSSAANLAAYDMVLFACMGMPVMQTPADQNRLINYANLGGRVFATHYSYVWLYNDPPFSTTATWNVGQANPPNPVTATIDQSAANPRGAAFAQWLVNVGASTTLGQVPIADARHDFNAVAASSQRWMYTPQEPLHYTFNTPVGAAPAAQCGRVLYSDFHVQNSASSAGMTFPAECSTGALTAQEHVLEFMIFDLSSCVPTTPPPPRCTPQTCAGVGANCGLIGDGCGGMLSCGTCPAGSTCGGGGMPNVCGNARCTPTTCAALGANCGPVGDGCGNVLMCGNCTAPDTCGGGGVPSVCGHRTCTPTTCAALGANCGPAGDGCGNLLNCGTCTAPDTCGGGGRPSVCGHPTCTPRTCAQLGANCGPVGDGCGNIINCGTCMPPDVCGGGMASVCGSRPCTPRTCAQAGANCGPVADGCGNLLNCGTCTAPDTCGGGGMASVCGHPTCTPRTCMQAGANCGPIADGCGGTVDCGMCPAGQSCGGGGVASVCGSFG